MVSPLADRTVTRIGDRSGTAAATSARIALPWRRLMVRLAAPRTMTEALGSGRSRENASRSGSTICTRAAATPSMVWIDRANSPSIARSRFTRCKNEFIPRPLVSSNNSQPGVPSEGSP